MSGPLTGIRVLDFTRLQQGPVATVMMAELGAEIWKVEPREYGDLARQIEIVKMGISRAFEANSRGKQSITLDVRTDEGREIALRLGEQADVVVDNFRPGVMDRLGLGYEDYRKVNPQIIAASASALGGVGPLASRPGYDGIGQAVGGVMRVQSRGPDDEPRTIPGGMADSIGGLQLCVAILAALVARDRTGEGQFVETSLLGSQVHIQGRQLLGYTFGGGQHYERRRRAPLHTFYEGKDGKWLMIVAATRRDWDKLCLVLEAEELLHDPRFATPGDHAAHREELEAELEQRFARRPRHEWLERLDAADIANGPVQSHADLVEYEQAWANGYLASVDHPTLGKVTVHGAPWRFSATPAEVPAAAPELGADTDAILAAAGYNPDEIAAFRAAEVI